MKIIGPDFMLRRIAAQQDFRCAAAAAVMDQHAVTAGFNLVTYVGGTRGPASAFASINGSLVAVYRWDPASDSWLKYVPGAPEWVSTLGAVFNGDVLFIEAASNGTWSY